jgi:uncharacterized RDD family membrane protein YckC
MFTIIGGDGKEYGPVTTDQVRNWLATGRANLDTKARAAGSEEWRRLGDFAEFGGAGGLPPVLGAASAHPDTASSSFGTADLTGLGSRFGAALVDGIAQMLCRLPTSIAVYRVISEQLSSGQQLSFMEVASTASESMAKSYPFLGALIVLQAVLLSRRGQSLGKLLTGIRIVRVRDGSQAGFVHAFLLRGAIPGTIELIPILGGLFWLVDVCFIFGQERRCVHDLIAGTKVVKAK